MALTESKCLWIRQCPENSFTMKRKTWWGSCLKTLPRNKSWHTQTPRDGPFRRLRVLLRQVGEGPVYRRDKSPQNKYWFHPSIVSDNKSNNHEVFDLVQKLLCPSLLHTQLLCFLFDQTFQIICILLHSPQQVIHEVLAESSVRNQI